MTVARTFENATSRAVEENVHRILKRAWLATRVRWLREDERMIRDFNGKPPADFGITRGDGIVYEDVLVEVKGRDRTYLGIEFHGDPKSYDHNPRLYVDIGQAKATALLALCRRFGVRGYVFFVMLQDRSVWWIEASALHRFEVRMGGRKPRPGAPHDKEPMILIPIKALTGMGSETADGGICDEHIAWIRAHRNG